MKLFSMLLILILASCHSYSELIESDYSYAGNFSKYRTFDFGTNSNHVEGQDLLGLVHGSVDKILTSWGYQRAEKRPDLYVFFSFYEEELTFHGYTQPEFQSWIRMNHRDIISGLDADTLDLAGSTQSMDEEYQPVQYPLSKGTLLISFFDRKKRRTVWQGYTSGVYLQDSKKNDRIVRASVVRILNQYRLLRLEEM